MLQKAALVVTGLFLFIGSAIAQQPGPQITDITGKVIDASAKEVLPYAGVSLMGPGRKVVYNTSTNPKGEYFIHTAEKVDSISFSYTGFTTRTIPVQWGHVQELNIALGIKELDSVIIKPHRIKGPRPIDTAAYYVFHQVLAHKGQNRSENLNSYKYEDYSKLQFSLLNASDKFINFWMFKPFKFVFKNVDSTESHDAFIPGLIKEQISDVYYRKHPKSFKKYVKADLFSGINNISIRRFMEYQFAEIDAYENIFVLAGVGFVGPFAGDAEVTYVYNLDDTTKIDGRVSYKLHFVGKVKEDIALQGWAWIDSATWAIHSIVFHPNQRANINFVDDYTIKQDFSLIDNKYWLMNREQLTTVGSLFKKKKRKMAILVTKTDDRRNIRTDEAIEDSIFKGPEEMIMMDSARQRSVAYWDTARFEPLTPQEKMVYHNVDSIKSLRIWRFYQSLGRFATAAYADAGPISIGRVLNFVSRNNVDGWRLRFGFETNPRFKNPGNPIHDFFHVFYFNVYGAYGLNDRLFHYQAMMRIALPRINDRWQILEAMYRYDFRVPGQDEDQTVLTFDNVLTLLSGTTLSKFMNVREARFGYEREWFKDFSTYSSFNTKTYYAIPGVVDFSRPIPGEGTPENIANFGITEFTTEFRYSYKDLYYSDLFYRFFLTTKYPVFLFRYALGMVNMQGNYFTYHNFQFTLKQRLSSIIGHTLYNFRAGEILGKAPYTASYLTQGNLGLLYDKFNYSLLSEFEFVSNQYASLWIDHHFDGFFFNKIPGFNKLKLREVIGIKSLIGAYSQKDADVLTPPGAVINNSGQLTLNGIKAPGPIPYLEASAGIENIFYIGRIDFVWRLTYREHALGPLWGIKLALSPGF